jgi:lipopolysaccharide biosynthesis glycosyltransferase
MSESNSKEIAIENIRSKALPSSPNNIQNFSRVYARMTRNDMSFYSNNNEEKDLILHHLKQKFLKVQNENDVVVSNGKNLLYFTIFLSDSYLDVLHMCLKSIVANTPNINFDVLFITDEISKSKIEQFDVISSFNVDYMILPSVKTGPMASLKKLNIFDYTKISEYSKILFFDADILCIKDLNIIFQKDLEPEKLYVCVTEIHKSPLLLTPTHGIMYLSKDDAEFIYDNPDIVPFNAGQYMFLNSSRMKGHFSNIRWLKNVWPDEYFYEQSFMNYYFVFRSLTKPMNMTFKKKINVSELSLTDGRFIEKEKEILTDDQLVCITFNINKKPSDDETQLLDFIRMKRLANNKKIMTVSGATSSNFSRSSMGKFISMPEGVLTEPLLMHSENTVAIHFAATLSDGLDKKTFMNLYANAHKLHI